MSVDTSVPHIARVYDYWLGGKDNFAVDRAAAEQVMETFPDILVSVRAQRAFLGRAVHYLVAEAGIRQFLDVGTGLPSANNTHEVAQRVAPQTRVVYVDNDPIVLLHARALLTSSPEGATAYIDADLRDTGVILAQAARILDFGQPVAVMLLGVLHCIPDSGRPGRDRVPARRRRAAGQLPHDRAPGQRRRHRADGHLDAELQRARRPFRSPRAATTRSPPSSRAWTCWNPAWCSCTGGGPAPATRAPAASWPTTAESAASRSCPAAGRFS